MNGENEKISGVDVSESFGAVILRILIGALVGYLVALGLLDLGLKPINWELPNLFGPKYQVGDTFQSRISQRQLFAMGCGMRTDCNPERNVIRITAIETVEDGGGIARFEILCPHFVPDSYRYNRLDLDSVSTDWESAPADTEVCL